MNCPAGLNWNEDLSYCDWPENASCEISGETSIESSESISSESFESEEIEA